MSKRLIKELVVIMPELKDVKPWERVGKRRSGDEPGRIAERVMPDDWLMWGDQGSPE